MKVVSAFAPAIDSCRSFEEYEKFMKKLVKVMTGGRKEGAKRFLVAGDVNIELEFLCIDGTTT